MNSENINEINIDEIPKKDIEKIKDFLKKVNIDLPEYLLEKKKPLYLFEVLRPIKLDKKNIYNGFIICCNDKFSARNRHPSGYYLDFEKREWYYKSGKNYENKVYVDTDLTSELWISPKDIEKLEVRQIGIPSHGIKEGTIWTL